MVKLVQRMAVKRAMHDNIARARRGLAVKPTTGQGAREMCVQAMNTLFTRMVEDGLIDRSPANGLKKGTRSASRRRALTDSELAQVFDVVSSGGDDAVLDLAMTWAEFELGARRGGILSLNVGQLDPVTQFIHLLEKGNRLDAQPCSLQLIEFLLAFAKSRGGDVCVLGSPRYDPNAPVFYYKDSTPETPHRVTGRRFDTLHRRVQSALPWANSMSYSGHALRHTIATMVERQAGFETARKMLRHARVRTTDTYTEASTADVARAIAAITAQDHPLASNPE
jgi:integrase